jgi:hypothetical protein
VLTAPAEAAIVFEPARAFDLALGEFGDAFEFDRSALGLVHGRRIAIVERGVIVEAELDLPLLAAVEPHPRMLPVDFKYPLSNII